MDPIRPSLVEAPLLVERPPPPRPEFARAPPRRPLALRTAREGLVPQHRRPANHCSWPDLNHILIAYRIHAVSVTWDMFRRDKISGILEGTSLHRTYFKIPF